jgi:hypothetical protein
MRLTIFVAVSLTMPSVGTRAVGSRNRSISCRDSGRAIDRRGGGCVRSTAWSRVIARQVSTATGFTPAGKSKQAMAFAEAGSFVVEAPPPSPVSVLPSGF